jgi:non-specific serine/threonine protein kinase
MALGDSWNAADARFVMGQILEYQTHYDRAIPILEESVREWEALGDPVRKAWALSFLGQAALDANDASRAEALYTESLELLKQNGVMEGVSGEFHQLGEVAALRGDIRGAATYYTASLDGTGSRENLVGKLVAVGRLAAIGGHAETAARVLGAAEALAGTIGYVRRQPEQARLDRDAAVARAALGDAGFEAASKAGQAIPSDQAVTEALAVLAVLADPASSGTAMPNDFAPSGTQGRTHAAGPDARTLLTYREQEVLALLCQRLTDAEIGDHLFLSKRTVEHHVSSILGKLGVANRRQAAAFAARNNLV